MSSSGEGFKGGFFEQNIGTADIIIVGEAFKAYIRGIFISASAYKNRLYKKVRLDLKEDIKQMETEHKDNLLEATRDKLNDLFEAFKILGCHSNSRKGTT